MIKRLFVSTLLTILFTLLTVEGGLRLFDPFGIEAYMALLRQLQIYTVDDAARGYLLPPGTYDFDNWQVTVLDDYSRRVPDTDLDADCTLVLLGDSVTFAQGVNDDQSWANLIARELPGVHVIDAALSGYNSGQIRAVWNDYPDVDAFLYLVLSNDPYAKESGVYFPLEDMSATTRTFRYFYYQLNPPLYDYPRFFDDLDTITADPRVTLVAFDEDFGHELAWRYPVTLIPKYTHSISQADSHADVRGNQEVAAGMLPIAQQIVQQYCAS